MDNVEAQQKNKYTAGLGAGSWHMDNSGMQMQMDNMHMDGSGGQGGYSDQIYMQHAAQQESQVRYLEQSLLGQRSRSGGGGRGIYTKIKNEIK